MEPQEAVQSDDNVASSPGLWCISYQQLMDVDQVACALFGKEDYTTSITMRDICQDILMPRCQRTGKSYALSLNPQGLFVDCFVTHSWDGNFCSFVQSIKNVFQTTLQKPNLWICAFALNQVAVEHHLGTEAPLQESPFVQALQNAKHFCVVRNANTDLYTRVWCVCEALFAIKTGLFPHKTSITGPDNFRRVQSSCVEAKATKPEDKDQIMKALLQEHATEEIDRMIQTFRTYGAPEQFSNENPAVTTEDQLRAILHPLCQLDNDLITDYMQRFQEGTREWALDGFDDWLRQEQTKPTHRVFVLAAQAGMGKTGIICKIASTPRRRKHIVAIHFFRHDDSRRSDPKHMLLSIAYQIACQLPEYRALLEESITKQQLTRDALLKDFNIVGLFDEFLRAPLEQIPAPPMDKRQYVIVLDALDECGNDESGNNNEILLCIQRHFIKFPPWIKILITTRPELPIIEKLKKFSPRRIEPDEEHNQQDLALFFRQLLQEVGSEDLKEPHSPTQNKAVTTLVEKSGGLFIYAAHLATMAREDGGGDVTLEELEAFPCGLEEFYEAQMERIISEVDEGSLEWKIVQFTTAANEPLHVETLQVFLQCRRAERVAALRNLSSFYSIDGNRKVQTYHKSFKDWLTNEEREDCEYFVDRSEVNRKLATLCLEILTKSGIIGQQSAQATASMGSSFPSEAVDFALRHGVSYLSTSKLLAETRRVVLDIGWLNARAQSGAGSDIEMDLGRLPGDKVVRFVGRAIGLSLNALRVDPRQLPGQLIGRLIPSTISLDENSVEVVQEMQAFLRRIKEYCYAFDWWCPIVPTWEPAEQACIRILQGHSQAIFSVAWAPDGSGRLATGSNDKTARIWNAGTGECELILEGHTGAVNCVAWSPCCSRLASASNDKTVRVDDAITGECEQVLVGEQALIGDHVVLSVAVSSDLKIASSCLRSIKISELKSGTLMFVLHQHEKTVRSIAFLNGGPILASASDDEHIGIWNILDGSCLTMLSGHTGPVYSVRWAGDGRLASCSLDGTVRCWNKDDYSCLQTSKKDNYDALAEVAWSPDGENIVVGTRPDNQTAEVRVLDVDSGQFKRDLGWHRGMEAKVDWSPNGLVASASNDATLRIWSPYMDQHSLPVFDLRYITCRVWSSDGSKHATGSDDWTIGIWDGSTGSCLVQLEGHRGAIKTLLFSRDSRWLASCSWDKTIRIWDMSDLGHSTPSCAHVLVGHSSGVRTLDWCDDGAMIASASSEMSVRVWCTATGTCKHILTDGFDSDVTVDDDRVSVLQSYSTALNLPLASKERVIRSLRWCGTTRLASGSQDGLIRLHNVLDGSCLHLLQGHTSFILSLECSRDGQKLVSGSQDHTVGVWQLATGTCLHVLQGHQHGVHQVMWSVDATQILSSSKEGIRVWNADTGACTQVITGCQSIPLSFDPADVSKIVQDLSGRSPDGKTVGMACKNVMVFKDIACAKLDKGTISFFERRSG